jgi:hypothetical protein
MPKTMRHVLKAHEVTLREPLHLDLDPAAPHDAKSRCDGAPASVRVAQNHPEYAVIEVTCPCGRTAHIRCDYSTAPVPARGHMAVQG